MNKQIAIVGSGPVSIIEGLYQAKIGNKVTLFEKGDRLGGAWGTIRYDEQHEFELGCHIWDFHKSTYAFIEKLLGEPLDVLSPRPIILIREKEIPYDWKNNLLIFKNIKHDPVAFIAGKTFVKPSVVPKKYKYPKGGCKRMMQRFEELLDEYGVIVKRNHHIKKIGLSDLGATLNDDEDLLFHEVKVTSLSEIEQVALKDTIIPIKTRRTIFTHYHLIIDGALKRPISYVRVMDHVFIHRISDMSSQSSNGKLVISVGVFKDKMDNYTQNGVEEMMKVLVKYGYIDKEAKLVQSFYNQFDGGTIDHHQIKKLQKLNHLEVLRSTNLIFSIKNHLRRWKTVL